MSCLIVLTLGDLVRNFGNICTKGFGNMQDSWLEIQDILNWVVRKVQQHHKQSEPYKF